MLLKIKEFFENWKLSLESLTEAFEKNKKEITETYAEVKAKAMLLEVYGNYSKNVSELEKNTRMNCKEVIDSVKKTLLDEMKTVSDIDSVADVSSFLKMVDTLTEYEIRAILNRYKEDYFSMKALFNAFKNVDAFNSVVRGSFKSIDEAISIIDKVAIFANRAIDEGVNSYWFRLIVDGNFLDEPNKWIDEFLNHDFVSHSADEMTDHRLRFLGESLA